MHERTAGGSKVNICSIHCNFFVSSWNCWPRWIQLDLHALTLILQCYVSSLSRLPGQKTYRPGESTSAGVSGFHSLFSAVLRR